MPGVELALAILATIDVCLKYGSKLVHACVAFKNADTKLARRIVRVNASWTRTSYQLGVLRRTAQSFPPEYLEMQDQILKVLGEKLKLTSSMLESLGANGEASALLQNLGQQLVKRAKYALREGRLNKAIDDLETWQGIYDPSWYLIIRAANPQIDKELARYAECPLNAATSPSFSLRNILRGSSQEMPPIWLKEEGIASLSIEDIPFSSTKLAQRSDSPRELILESISCPAQANSIALTKDVQHLAGKLSLADTVTFGLLNCKGVVKQVDPLTKALSSFTFVFRMPDGLSEPRSLRDMLRLGDDDHSLSDRFLVASELAKSVCSMHIFGFVHKNIRPENIVMLKGVDEPRRHAYLVGFENFRAAEGNTSRLGDTAWDRNLYRHPRRQGEHPDEAYKMQHDIYSLGVCLLELGLWQSFIEYDLPRKDPRPSPALGLSLRGPEVHDPYPTKDQFLSIARSALRRRMGTKYAQIVETCLTCLDPENTDFGDEGEFQDADGILVGVRYIEKVGVTFSLSRDVAHMS